MDLQLENKCALVTGSSKGLGEAMARSLAAEGAKVIVHGRNQQALRQMSGCHVPELCRDQGGVGGHVFLIGEAVWSARDHFQQMPVSSGTVGHRVNLGRRDL